MAWAVPFAGNLVRDFQYEHFRYWNVPPRWDKNAYEHGTLVLVPKMSHRKISRKVTNLAFSYFCSGDQTLDVSGIAWLVTRMSHQSDTSVVTTWLVTKMSHRKKKNYMVDLMTGATFEKWATISLILIKKNGCFMKEFLHFKFQLETSLSKREPEKWVLQRVR